MPVTTTRLMAVAAPLKLALVPACLDIGEQADAQVLGLVDQLAVGLDQAVGDAEGQLASARRA